MKMNPLAKELNQLIQQSAPHVFEMLSDLGRELYFPKGILSQTAEARQKATRYNATIGIAKEGGQAMHLASVMKRFSELLPDDIFPYAPAAGKPELRERWREEILRKNPTLRGKDISLPVVTSGITHGLSLVGDLFVQRGDVILLPDKVWGNYHMIFGVRRGAEIVRYRFFSDDGGFDTERFSRTVSEHAGRGKIIVLLNFPNNPTGYSITEPEGRAICDALTAVAESGCSVVAVCDDAYFGLFYEADVLKESIFGYLADCHKRILAIKLDGATKEDYVWGLRVGFITFAAVAKGGLYDALEKKTAGAIRGNISNCPHHSQSILLRAMADEGYAEEKERNFATLQARAAKVKDVLRQSRFSTVWRPYPFNSGYFMCLRLNQINAEQFRLRLLERYGIGVITTDDRDIRIAFSCIEKDDISELFDLMFRCAQEMADEHIDLR